MVADMAADKEEHLVADMVADEKKKKKKVHWKNEEEKRVPNLVRGALKRRRRNINIGRGGRLIGPKLVRLEAYYRTCVSSILSFVSLI